jgi:hypothetical protein
MQCEYGSGELRTIGQQIKSAANLDPFQIAVAVLLGEILI